MNRLRSQFGDLAVRRAPEGLVLLQHQLRLRFGVGDAGAAIEPPVHRLAVLLRVAVVGRPDEVGDVVLRAEQAVEPLQPLVRRFVPACVEVVLLLGQDDDRLRRERREKVLVIEAERQRARRALLHVGAQLVLHVPPEFGDEAARRGHGPAIVHAAQPRGHRAAAGVAGDAEVAHVDLLAGDQVIERADAVPRAPRAEALVDQDLLDAGVVVLAGAGPAQRLPVRVHVLHPLALADRVEDQDDVAQPRQALAEGLIRLDRLAVRRMPARADHARQREASSLRDVEIRRHQEPRPALEEDVLDLVGIALDDFRHARVERRLLGERPERLTDLSADRLHVRFGVGLRLQRGEPFQPLLVYLVLARHEELLDHARESGSAPRTGACLPRMRPAPRRPGRASQTRYPRRRWKGRTASGAVRCARLAKPKLARRASEGGSSRALWIHRCSLVRGWRWLCQPEPRPKGSEGWNHTMAGQLRLDATKFWQCERRAPPMLSNWSEEKKPRRNLPTCACGRPA